MNYIYLCGIKQYNYSTVADATVLYLFKPSILKLKII